jgi:RNA polymerase sigma factor (sigma-70 family)
MATSQMSGVIQHLRRTVLLRDGAGLTDGQLLEDYTSRRDEAALAALVRRHGPLVWGVCRRVLFNYHDAEDAFQATFLVLVRKAASIVPRGMVANWLYGVAHQTALKARATAAKRKGRERQVTEMPEPAVAEQDLWRDLQPLLDEELSRLPDKYRAVIVLCDLEGKTRKEAARQLGVPEGTVGGWLGRARATLAKRLAQRGVVLSGGALAAVLSQEMASAGVPTSAVSSVIKAASLLGAGQAAATGVISAKVALTEGVLKAMLFTKLKVATAILLAVAIAGAGTARLLDQTHDETEKNAPTDFSANARSKRTLLTFKREPASDKKDEKPKQGGEQKSDKTEDKPTSKDLRKIEPPGGVPLRVSERGKEISVEYLKQATKRLESAPPEDLDKWVAELERLMGQKLDGDLAKQGCRTYFVTHMSMAFDDLKWSDGVADILFLRAQNMPTAEAKAWKEAFAALLKKEIGQTDKEVLDGGPAYAVPLVLIPVDALHKGQKYSTERGRKYRERLKQLTAEDVSLWKGEVDEFGGTELDAAVNIILLDDFFEEEKFQRDKFKAAIGARKK